jgi:hypothetical protein
VWSGNESPVAGNISRIVACSSTCFTGYIDHLATEGPRRVRARASGSW